jgi:hypothetical protein
VTQSAIVSFNAIFKMLSPLAISSRSAGLRWFVVGGIAFSIALFEEALNFA